MTTMDSEVVASILCTSKQTRFDIAAPNYRELDVEGLFITVATSIAATATKGKTKARAKADGAEIICNAKLRLKAGQRYALVGKNGTGKSTLLKAIAEKLIPGIPEKTKVAILQQTNVGDANVEETPKRPVTDTGEEKGPTVLEEVIDRATARNGLQQEIAVLSSAISSNNPYGALRGLRQLRKERLQKDLFLLDKDARLRSGARGSQARKVLLTKEKEVATYRVLYEQTDGEITSETLARETTEAADMLAELEIQVEPSRTAEIESRAKTILAGLGFSDAYMGRSASSLSGGWKMRTALAAVLLQETDILILDEPTNFLDLLGIMWLQRHLTSMAEALDPPTLILVSHDRDFISLCTDLVLLKDKALDYFHGDLPTYELSQAEKQLHLGKMKEAKDKQKEHMEKTVIRNMKEGRAKNDQNKMRQAKSRQKKLDDRWGLEVNSHGGRFKLNRDLVGYHLSARADIELEKRDRPVRFVLPEPPDLRFPGPLISLEKASFRYPPEGRGKKTPSPLVLTDISLSVHMGDRVGVLGLNGGGKSTLIKLLVGKSTPTTGEMTAHPRLSLGYYSQHAVETLQQTGHAEPTLTALVLLTREAGDDLDEGAIRALLGSLGLPGRLASDVPVRKLSGGQLVRLELARILWKDPHCLVLDEVTTHLDYETVTALREALHDWEGAVVLASHDRWFMRGVVEGLADDDKDSDDSGVEEETPRRRVVYRLKAGQMTLLLGGVQEFERVIEKRVHKLTVS